MQKATSGSQGTLYALNRHQKKLQTYDQTQTKGQVSNSNAWDFKGDPKLFMRQCKTLTHSDDAQNTWPKLIKVLRSFESYCPETDILPDKSLKVQDAFRNLLIHGILPFTALIAVCCVLHRCSSRGIHRLKLWKKFQQSNEWEFRECFTTPARGSGQYKTGTVNEIYDFESCHWSFRRFTYGNLVTTSPSSKW